MALNLINVHLDDFKWVAVVTLPTNEIFFYHVKNGSFVHPRMVIGSSLDCVVSSKKKRNIFCGKKEGNNYDDRFV